MTTTLTRRDRQKIARRKAILEAARQVFLAGRASQATIETVAQEAQVSKGTVYLYFPSKEALVGELLREGLQLLAAQLEAAYAEGEALTPDIRLGRVAGAYLEFAQAQPDYIRLNTVFHSGQLEPSIPVDLAHDIRSLNSRGFELMARAVREGISQKIFRPGDPGQVAAALWSALNGAILTTGNPDNAQLLGTQAGPLFQAILEVFLRALRRPKR